MTQSKETYRSVSVTLGTLLKPAVQIKAPLEEIQSLAFEGPMNDLTERVQAACNQLDHDGYEVLSVMPVNAGIFDNKWSASFGISVTGGVVITGKLRAANPDDG